MLPFRPMTYESPFRPIGHAEIDGDDPLCLSMSDEPHPNKELLGSYFQAASWAADADLGQVVWFASRHMAEIGLKMVIADQGGTPPTGRDGHTLDLLIGMVDGSKVTIPEEVEGFIRDLHHYDSAAFGGRYATDTRGNPTLPDVCCAEPTLVGGYVAEMWGFFNQFAPLPVQV